MLDDGGGAVAPTQAAIANGGDGNKAPDAAAPNHNHRQRMGGFLNSHNRIKSGDHDRGLKGLLQLANGQEGGIFAALGHSNRRRWVGENIPTLYVGDGGPLAPFRQLGTEQLMSHIRTAEKVAILH